MASAACCLVSCQVSKDKIYHCLSRGVLLSYSMAIIERQEVGHFRRYHVPESPVGDQSPGDPFSSSLFHTSHLELII